MTLIAPLLNDYDLVLVQEDFSYHNELSADALHPYQSRPKSPESHIIADGLNRFSQFPFDDLIRIQWAECYGSMEGGTVTGDADCLAEKGFSLARTELAPGVYVDVYNHHAEAGGGPEDHAARQLGFAQFTQFIQENSAGNAIIIAGDPNLHREGEDDGPVLTAFEADNELHDVCTFLECGYETIDRFFFRNGTKLTLNPTQWRIAEEFVTKDGSRLSDHNAIHVSFDWQEN